MVFRPRTKTTRDLTGERFGRLVVISLNSVNRRGRVWLCRCDCGNTAKVVTDKLTSGHNRSCGCLRVVSNHGLSKTPEYRVWAGMRDRCFNPDCKGYPYYGGRGIIVCDRWLDFLQFLADMGPRPSPDHSIDRIDPYKGYTPENCRWATNAEQSRNRTDNVFVTIDGQTKVLSDWCRIYGMSQSIVRARMKKGLSAIEALTGPTPPRVYLKGLSNTHKRRAMANRKAVTA